MKWQKSGTTLWLLVSGINRKSTKGKNNESYYVQKKSEIKSRENIPMMLYRCTIKLRELECVII